VVGLDGGAALLVLALGDEADLLAEVAGLLLVATDEVHERLEAGRVVGVRHRRGGRTRGRGRRGGLRVGRALGGSGGRRGRGGRVLARLRRVVAGGRVLGSVGLRARGQGRHGEGRGD